MDKKFGDSSITIHYIQQILNETFNDEVFVSGEYYKHFDMHYGFAHFIAKYLDYMYPILDDNVKEEYSKITDTTPPRERTQMISICNYFLSDNRGNRLRFNPNFSTLDSDENNYHNVNKSHSSGNPGYEDIYNKFMVVYNTNDEIKATYDGKYFIKNDPPLFIQYDAKAENKYSVNNNTIFPLTSWKKQKSICEIDDLVASFLMGRTIGPMSSMEDIYYVQQLLIRNRTLEKIEKGVWCPPGKEHSIYDMTETVSNYQKSLVSNSEISDVFVTGYFDIITESYALKEVGVPENAILGL